MSKAPGIAGGTSPHRSLWIHSHGSGEPAHQPGTFPVCEYPRSKEKPRDGGMLLGLLGRETAPWGNQDRAPRHEERLPRLSSRAPQMSGERRGFQGAVNHYLPVMNSTPDRRLGAAGKRGQRRLALQDLDISRPFQTISSGTAAADGPEEKELVWQT